MTAVLSERVFPELLDWHEELTAFRRDLHAHPDLRFATERTCEKLVESLQSWGIDTIDRSVESSLLVLIEGEKPGPTVALRADMDALPMSDLSANPWKSTIEGSCHACGHDGHTAWLLGALRWLHAHRADFSGRVLGIFQPAEEIARGALRIVEAGVLERYGVKEIYGAHDEPSLSKGVFGLRTGPLQASCDFFFVTVKGVGTHGARPHTGVDPIPVACQMVEAFQTIVSRKVNPIEKAVLSVCSITAGRFGTPNVIPHEAQLSGTVRTFSQDVRDLIEKEMARMSAGIAQANGAAAEFRYERLTSPVVNAQVTTDAVEDFVSRRFGDEALHLNFPLSMGGEDFAEYQQRVPGTMIRVGIGDEAHTVSVHNPAFDFNDEVIPAAATVLAGVALERLRALG